MQWISRKGAAAAAAAIGGIITGATLGSVLFAGAAGALSQDNANFFWDSSTHRLGLGTNAPSAKLHIVQSVNTSGSPSAFILTGGAHTTLAASAESNDIQWNLARTVQFATGALTLQRAVYISAPTYGFVGASTVTDAYTVGIDIPVAGTNATFTRRGGLYIVSPSSSTAVVHMLQLKTNGSDALYFGTRLLTSGSMGVLAASSPLEIGSNSSTLNFVTNNTIRGTIATQGGLSLSQTGAAGTLPSILSLTPGTHTALTASTEYNNIVLNAATQTWSTGALTTQRSVYLAAQTIAFAGASTVTTAIGLDVEAPIAGTNATITNNFAARFNGVVSLNASTSRQMTIQGSSGNAASIAVSASNTVLSILGNRSAASTGADINLDGSATRTDGILTQISNNGTARMQVNYYGGITLTQGAGATGTLKSFLSTRANHTNQTASTEVIDLSLTAYTRQWATGNLTLQREINFDVPTYAAVGASTFTTVINLEVAVPVAGTNMTFTNAAVAARFLGNTIIGNVLPPAAGPTNTLLIGSGTAPTSSPADSITLYSSDDAAGHTIPSFYCEGTNVIATGQADSASSVRVKMRINGTVVTLLAI